MVAIDVLMEMPEGKLVENADNDNLRSFGLIYMKTYTHTQHCMHTNAFRGPLWILFIVLAAVAVADADDD